MAAAKQPVEKKTLFAILGEQKEVVDALETLEQNSGNDEAVAILKGVTETLVAAEKEKIDAFGAVITALETRAAIAKAEADSYSDEQKRLSGMAKALLSQAKRLKEFLKAAMKAKGVDVLEGEVRKFRRQRNAQPALIIDDYPSEAAMIEAVPAEFIKYEAKIDAEAVAAALKEGAELDFARYSYGDFVRMY